MAAMGKREALLGKWNYIFLMGESGGGKGTLVKNIRKYWLPDISSASMGDIFREKAQTDPEIKRLIDEGVLVDDETVVSLFKEIASERHPAIIDGFPRNRNQALQAIKYVKSMDWRVLVIDIHCDIEVIIERLLARGRADDKLSIMHKRNVDHKTLHPAVMEEIRHRPDLFDIINVDGNKPMNIAFTNFLLDVLRLVDLLSLYDMPQPTAEFKVEQEETSVDGAINRWLSQLLLQIQDEIDS